MIFNYTLYTTLSLLTTFPSLSTPPLSYPFFLSYYLWSSFLAKDPPSGLFVVLGGRGAEGTPYKTSVRKDTARKGIAVDIESMDPKGKRS